MADKQTKQAKGTGQERAIFRLIAPGVVTARDEWVYGRERATLEEKAKFLVREVDKLGNSELPEELTIKASSGLKINLKRSLQFKYDDQSIVRAAYRPFEIAYYYFDPLLSDRLTDRHFEMLGEELTNANKIICFDREGDFSLSTQYIPDFHFTGDSQCLPLYRYSGGERIHNITDFALKAFRDQYADPGISREDIFHYVYAVLHHPAYREKYALNLRQEFPRVPFYPDFGRWVAWGRELMGLHVDFETVAPYPLERVEVPPKGDTPEARALAARARLKVVRDAAKVPTGAIELDGLTTLRGVPPEAWRYRLGNRSALEWVLERHKEATPRDPTIRERFHTYRLADHKERVVDLLARVTTVSVETVRILGEMPPETV